MGAQVARVNNSADPSGARGGLYGRFSRFAAFIFSWAQPHPATGACRGLYRSPSPVAPRQPVTQDTSTWTEFKEAIREEAHMDPVTWTDIADIVPPLALGLAPLAIGPAREAAGEYLRQRREGLEVDRRGRKVAKLERAAVAA
jgi:hypothetical protein